MPANRGLTSGLLESCRGCPPGWPVTNDVPLTTRMAQVQSPEQTAQVSPQPTAATSAASVSGSRPVRLAFSFPPSERRAGLERPATDQPPAAASAEDPSSFRETRL